MQLSCLGREKKMTQSDKMMSDEILVWVCCAEQDRASQMYSDQPHSKEASQTSLWCDTVARMLRNRFFYLTISCWREGILTRIFILLVTVKEFADRGHPVAPTHSQGVDDVWTNQNVVGNIMLENISCKWCVESWNTPIQFLCWPADCTIISNTSEAMENSLQSK